jgi:hypothetical protein
VISESPRCYNPGGRDAKIDSRPKRRVSFATRQSSLKLQQTYIVGVLSQAFQAM